MVVNSAPNKGEKTLTNAKTQKFKVASVWPTPKKHSLITHALVEKTSETNR